MFLPFLQREQGAAYDSDVAGVDRKWTSSGHVVDATWLNFSDPESDVVDYVVTVGDKKDPARFFKDSVGAGTARAGSTTPPRCTAAQGGSSEATSTTSTTVPRREPFSSTPDGDPFDFVRLLARTPHVGFSTCGEPNKVKKNTHPQ